mmetsp:Transcript_40802/g.105857  ORF Transcript_40802/g.105857 Transcript_40802/m.105857 type:complete len:99 (-) Transcript_40802:720-1016(-)
MPSLSSLVEAAVERAVAARALVPFETVSSLMVDEESGMQVRRGQSNRLWDSGRSTVEWGRDKIAGSKTVIQKAGGNTSFHTLFYLYLSAFSTCLASLS